MKHLLLKSLLKEIQLMSKPVIHAQLYEGFFVHGVGEIQKTLPPQNKTLSNLVMTLQDNGALLIEYDEANYRKSFTLGAASVKVATHPSSLVVKANKESASVIKARE